MHLYRAVRPLVLGRRDAAAIPADGGSELRRARGVPPGHGAAEAVADDAELFGAEVCGGGLDIEHHLPIVQLHAVVAALGDIVRRVTKFHPDLGAVEQRRRADVKPAAANRSAMSRM
jgi:hypothetical protein